MHMRAKELGGARLLTWRPPASRPLLLMDSPSLPSLSHLLLGGFTPAHVLLLSFTPVSHYYMTLCMFYAWIPEFQPLCLECRDGAAWRTEFVGVWPSGHHCCSDLISPELRRPQYELPVPGRWGSCYLPNSPDRQTQCQSSIFNAAHGQLLPVVFNPCTMDVIHECIGSVFHLHDS